MEELFFINTGTTENPRRIFVHGLFNKNKTGAFVLLFNPFLDRIAAFSAQSTQVEIARALHANGINTLHFDYYGTGDSGGELYEVDFASTLDDVSQIIRFIKNTGSPSKIILFGMRFGADLALRIAHVHDDLDSFVLYEPVINGSFFLKQKRYIVKANHLLWGIDPQTDIEINGEQYEDFDGILLSENNKNFICNMRSDALSVSGKNILLFNVDATNHDEKLDSISNKKHIANFVASHSKQNRIREVVLNLADDQSALIRKINSWIGKFVLLVDSATTVENKV